MIAAIEILEKLSPWLNEAFLGKLLAGGLILVIGLPLAALAARVVYRVSAARFSP